MNAFVASSNWIRGLSYLGFNNICICKDALVKASLFVSCSL